MQNQPVSSLDVLEIIQMLLKHLTGTSFTLVDKVWKDLATCCKTLEQAQDSNFVMKLLLKKPALLKRAKQ